VHTPDQNKTDLETFDYLYEEKIAAVNVVWATGKHADHNHQPNIVRYREKLES
jgi:thiamine pyrophosphokinase